MNLLYKLLLTLAFLTINFVGIKAQEYGDPSFYLIDSLETDIIGQTDSLLLDSCLTIYHNETQDTLKVEAIKFIVEESWDKNIWPIYNEWLYVYIKERLDQTLTLEEELYFKSAYASVVNNQGYLFSTEGDAHQASIYYKESLEIQLSIDDKEGAATSMNNIGTVYKKVGDIANAIDYYHKSAELYAELNNLLGQAQTLNNLGHIHHSQGNDDLAIKYFEESLTLFQEQNHQKGEATLLNSIGYFYYNDNQHDLALEYYKKALAIRKEINDQSGIASSLNNMASAFGSKLELDSARYYYLESIPYYQSQNNKSGLAITYSNIARNSFSIGLKKDALSYAKKGVDLAEETKSPDIIATTAKAYSQILEETGNTVKALVMFHRYVEMRDSTLNQETKVAAAKSEAKYEFLIQKAVQEKEFEQEMALSQIEHNLELELSDLEHEKKITVEQKAKENQKILSIAIAVVLALTGIFLIIVFMRLKVTRRQKTIIESQKTVVERAHNELEEKNKEILDSIYYAKRIQTAILPPQKLIKKYLPESFILYKPKDVVAGDFYWLEHRENRVLVAACDCTGHGVPGAMVSVVCNNGLNRSVREHNLTTPGAILDKTREIVVQEFEKSEEEVKDGMDVALVSIDKKSNGSSSVQFAGANNPLWIIRNVSKLGDLKHASFRDNIITVGDFKLYEIRADHQPIGKFVKPQPYSNHQIELSKGDHIYIFSDGYADQFGGEKGKKFKTANFKNLLLSIQDLSLEEQLQNLENTFEKWKKDFEQLDDICVIGLKI